MQPSPEMASFVNACEVKHSTYLGDTGDRLKMHLGRRDLPLVLERMGPNIIRVAHEIVDQNGQIAYDPEVLFFTGYEKWIAMEVSAPSTLPTEVGKRGKRMRYVTLNSTDSAVKDCKFNKQKELSQFVKYWVRCLRARKWHENSTDALYQQATLFPDDNHGEDEEEGVASTERVKDLLQDELEDAGLMAEEPAPLYRPGKGIESVTISSGNKSVTLTGKH
jgi:hypothetical protein